MELIDFHKDCTKCLKSLPATLVFFHKQKSGKYGLQSVCKQCRSIYRKQYTSNPEYKKKHAEYEKLRRKKLSLEDPNYYKGLYKKYAGRMNSLKKEKYWKDPEYRAKRFEHEKKYKESGRRKQVASTPEQMEKSRVRSRVKYWENRELSLRKNKEWRDANPEYGKIKSKERYEKLPDKYIIYTIKRSIKSSDTIDLPPGVIETKRLIIKIKRELNKIKQ